MKEVFDLLEEEEEKFVPTATIVPVAGNEELWQCRVY
jgi:hypothetical protein